MMEHSLAAVIRVVEDMLSFSSLTSVANLAGVSKVFWLERPGRILRASHRTATILSKFVRRHRLPEMEDPWWDSADRTKMEQERLVLRTCREHMTARESLDMFVQKIENNPEWPAPRLTEEQSTAIAALVSGGVTWRTFARVLRVLTLKQIYFVGL
jgi:hypothetical protein